MFLAQVLGFFVAAAYLPGIGSPILAPRWASLALGSALGLAFCRATGRPNLVALAFMAWATLSLAWSPYPYPALEAWFGLVILAGVFLFAQRVPSFPVEGFALGICLWSVVFVTCAILGKDPGDFINFGVVGESAALAIVASIAFGRWPLALGCVPALALSGSRTALVALAASGLLWIWHRDRTGAIFCAIGATLCLPWLAFTGHTGAFNTEVRLDLWSSMLPQLSLFGHGAGSFPPLAPTFAPNPSHFRWPHAHNDYLQLAFEYGAVGIALGVALCASALVRASEPSRLVLVAVFAEAATTSVLYDPSLGFVAAWMLGSVLCVRSSLLGAVLGRRMAPFSRNAERAQ